MTSPTARSLALLRADGYLAQVVERYNAHARVRVDLFGCIDLLAVKPGEAVLGVQATTASNLAARAKKALACPRLRTWLAAECRFVLHGWAKKGPRGKRKLWHVSVREVTLADLDSG